MMDKIQRYSVASVAIFTLTYKCSDGDYVRYEDYAALLAEAERLRGAIETHCIRHQKDWMGFGGKEAEGADYDQDLWWSISSSPPPPAIRQATGEEGEQ